MADTIFRSRVALEYPNGGPGVTTWYWTLGFGGAQGLEATIEGFHDELEVFYLGLRGVMPDDVSYRVENDVDELEIATGYIVAQHVDPGSRPGVSGTAPDSGNSRATQVYVGLRTDVYREGKRLRGGHYHGPIASNALDNAGYITTSLYSGLPDQYIAVTSGVGPRLAVYHRPRTLGDGTGYYGDVVGVKVKPVPASLRSRRD